MPASVPHRRLYNGLVVPAVMAALPLAARLSPKVRRGLAARRGLLARWQAAARRVAGGGSRLWVHAASAGETLQARPLIEGAREAHPSGALFLSFFSPSAERTAAGWTVPDASDYLPYDAPGPMRRLVDILDPGGIVLVGAELWPNLVWAAADRGIPLGQACCRLVGAGRMRWPARGLTRSLYARFRAVGAVAAEDAELLRALGVPAEAVAVTGDTRVDVTLARLAAAADQAPAWPRAPAAGFVIAGSTWPADDAVVLPAFERLRRSRPDAVLLLAPHEPDEPALTRLERTATGLGLAVRRLGDPPTEAPPEVVLVDRVGLLYRLYAGATAAYVGGGFGGSVHNTMEPAAHGVPVAIGPRHGGAHEIQALRAAGGLAVIRTAAELAGRWERWLAEPGAATAAGGAARAALERMAGAAERTRTFFRARGLPL